MKIYQRSRYEKHRLVFIAYVLDGLSPNSGLAASRGVVQHVLLLYIACNRALFCEYEQ